jgi:hypothetical protein
MKKLNLKIFNSIQFFLKFIRSSLSDNRIGKKEHVTLRAKDFKYPNGKEFIKFHNRCPKLEIFGFEHTHPMALIINNSLPMDEASRLSNLYWWDGCLINRFQKVCHTYVFVLTHFSRGFSDDWKENTHNQVINHVMFEYYAEVFYYYFFSARDIIAQILSLYFSVQLAENAISFNQTFLNMITDQSVNSILLKFNEDTKDSREFRNSFTHRFTPNIPDYRSIISKDNRSLSFGGGNFIQSEKMMDNIDKSLKCLSNLMTQLKLIIK